jgi:hypothetical protein
MVLAPDSDRGLQALAEELLGVVPLALGLGHPGQVVYVHQGRVMFRPQVAVPCFKALAEEDLGLRQFAALVQGQGQGVLGIQRVVVLRPQPGGAEVEGPAQVPFGLLVQAQVMVGPPDGEADARLQLRLFFEGRVDLPGPLVQHFGDGELAAPRELRRRRQEQLAEELVGRVYVCPGALGLVALLDGLVLGLLGGGAIAFGRVPAGPGDVPLLGDE